MGRFFGGLLWLLGAMSVAWTVLAIMLLVRAPADCAVCQLVVRGHVGPEVGAWSTWMMAATALNWIIMVMLDIVFAYLVALSVYNRHLCMPSFTLSPEAAHGSSQGSSLRNDG